MLTTLDVRRQSVTQRKTCIFETEAGKEELRRQARPGRSKVKCDLEHFRGTKEWFLSPDWEAGAGWEQGWKREAFLWRQKPRSRRPTGR